MKKLHIPVVLGTARKGANSIKVARYLFGELKKKSSIKTKLLKVETFMLGRTVPDWQSKKLTRPWSKEVDAADAFVFVIPEYNHGYPGELKMVMDQVFDQYYRKPCLLVGVSTGRFGGARVLENISPVITNFEMVITGKLYFDNVKELFDQNGNIKDPHSWGKRVQKQYHMLYEDAKGMKVFRENEKSA
ncbi:NAD(P)H-dependent oxidoreductase [Candidatus Nomurabacteria bacterium]|nr:NAD(P)H-dependent oxidoreductase [Candidatus Nomurabacteria bacterium]